MVNYWNGLGNVPGDVSHILRIIGFHDLRDIRQLVEALNLNSAADIVFIQHNKWTQMLSHMSSGKVR